MSQPMPKYKNIPLEPEAPFVRAFGLRPEGGFRRTGFPVSAIERISELGSASSAIHFRSGAEIKVALAYAALEEKLYMPQQPCMLIDLCDVTGEKAAALSPTPGQKMPDGTVYICYYGGKDWYTTERDVIDHEGFSHTAAALYAKAMRAYGHIDWEVPNDHVLNEMYLCRNTGSLKGTFNGNAQDERRWYRSSTPMAQSERTYDQDFSNGTKTTAPHAGRLSLRCVRGIARGNNP